MPRATASLAYLTLIIVVLGSIVFATFVIVPAWGTNGALRDEVRQKQAELEERRQLRENINKRERELQTYSEERSDLDIILPEEFNQANFLAALENATREARLVVETMGAPVTPTVRRGEELGLPKNIEAIDVPMKVVGTYAALREFVNQIERMPVLSHIRSVDISQGEGSNMLSIELSVRTYTQSAEDNTLTNESSS